MTSYDHNRKQVLQSKSFLLQLVFFGSQLPCHLLLRFIKNAEKKYSSCFLELVL